MSLSDAKILVEASTLELPLENLTNIGNNKKFVSVQANYISQFPDSKAEIIPSGFTISPDFIPSISGDDDSIDIPVSVANLNGVRGVNCPASIDLSISRPATNVAQITSVTKDQNGATVLIQGIVGLDQNFDLSGRGAAAQPPEIPALSIEQGQIRLTSSTSAPILESEIFQSSNSEKEEALFPPFDIIYTDAEVDFKSDLPTIHTGGTTKAIFAKIFEPQLLEQDFSDDFSPANPTSSNTTTQKYSGTIASESRGFDTCTFTAVMLNGIDSDPITFCQDKIALVIFYPDRNEQQHSITVGRVNYSVANPSADNPTATVTVAAQKATKNYSS